MNIVIRIYIFITITLLLFDISYIIVMNIRADYFYAQNDTISRMISDELTSYSSEKGFSRAMKSFLTNELTKTKNLILLHNALAANRGLEDDVYAELRFFLFPLVEIYKHRKPDEQAFYALTVSELPYCVTDQDSFYASLFEFLETTSIYVFSNTMHAFYSFSDPLLLGAAIKKVSDRTGFYSGIMLVDGLLKFNGDKETLHGILREKFYDYEPPVQEALVKYFRLSGGHEDDLCLEILKNRRVNEKVIYEAMRYFKVCCHPEAKKIFIGLLEEPETYWVMQMLALEGLKYYNEEKIRKIMLKKCTMDNMYIQTTAVRYMVTYEMKQEELMTILGEKSSYATDLLLYHYREDERITHFILDYAGLGDEGRQIADYKGAAMPTDGDRIYEGRSERYA